MIAAKLADRPYSVVITYDDTDPRNPYYIAENPELPGCLSDGETPEDALANLADARREYILSLLEDGLPVPSPATVTNRG